MSTWNMPPGVSTNDIPGNGPDDEDGPLTIYVSGPMTGLPDLNFPAFHAAAEQLRARGFDVLNPAELNPDQGATWEECMRVNIGYLSLSGDAIALLDGWQNSRGAQLEHHIGRCLGMTIRTLGEWLEE